MTGWRKSSYSGNGGNCVEWRVSSYCNGGECVQIGRGDWVKSSHSASGNCAEVSAPRNVLLRDSKLGDDSPILEFSPAEWEAFTGSVKRGKLALT